MNYIETYVDFLISHTPQIKKPLSVICDGSNGVAGVILEKLLPKLSLNNFSIINGNPDPEFPAHGPNPLLKNALDELKEKVKNSKADFGVAFDGDGDRAFFVDETGEIVPSYIIATLFFLHNKPPYVCDEIIYQTLRCIKIFPEKEIVPSKIGQVSIKKTMRDSNANVAAEFSGHFNHKEFFNCDSGIFTFLQILSALSSQPDSLYAFRKKLPVHEISNEDVKTADKKWDNIRSSLEKNLANKNGFQIEKRDGISIISENNWANVRPSNTEPIVRIYAGSPSMKETLSLIAETKKSCGL